jgi:hypothetical protein
MGQDPTPALRKPSLQIMWGRTPPFRCTDNRGSVIGELPAADLRDGGAHGRNRQVVVRLDNNSEPFQ